MNQGYFITGTDTDAGKTIATVALMHYFKTQGKTVVGMKPVASGCIEQDGHLRNADALALQANASVELDYDLINPYAFALPVSPHLAAGDTVIDFAVIGACLKRIQEVAEIVLVEGAGGWYAPVTARQDMADLAKTLGLPVILVVAVKLGCINHAKLSYQAIVQSGVTCAGWIGVCVQPEQLMREQNIDTLKTALGMPLLGILPYLSPMDFTALAAEISL